jgi:hypothetical protein
MGLPFEPVFGILRGVIKRPTAVGVLPALIVSIVLVGSLVGSSHVPFRVVLASSCGYAEGRPDVSGVSPKSGPVTGGTTVTITGSGFCNLLSVKFGAVAATSFTVISNTQMTAVSPAEPAGTVDVRVTTVGGTSPIIDGDRFTFGPLPSPSPEATPPTT